LQPSGIVNCLRYSNFFQQRLESAAVRGVFAAGKRKPVFVQLLRL